MKNSISNRILVPVAVAHRINLIRKKQKLTQQQLAEVLSVSQPAVSRYLRDRIPPPGVLVELARLGKTTIEWILVGESFFYEHTDSLTVRERENEAYTAERRLTERVTRLPEKARMIIYTLAEMLDPLSEPPADADG